MLSINQTIYDKIGTILLEQIGENSYYSDKIAIEEPDIDYYFEASLIIYFKEHIYPEGRRKEISNIVPVWWECHTVTDDGEQLNDFDFSIIKRMICN